MKSSDFFAPSAGLPDVPLRFSRDKLLVQKCYKHKKAIRRLTDGFLKLPLLDSNQRPSD